MNLKYGISCFLVVLCTWSCGNEPPPHSPARHTPLHPVLPYGELDVPSGKMLDMLSAEKTGLHFSNDLSLSYQNSYFEFLNLFIGAGLGVGDFNQDGLPDVFFSGSLVEDRIYINKGGLTFEDVTKQALPKEAMPTTSTGVTIVDINHDGYDDIYVCRGYYPKDAARRKNRLFINNKDLTFSEQAETYGLADTSFSIHSSFFDYDNDGDLDMYLLNHPNDWNDRAKLNNYEKIGEGKNLSDKLFRNNNDGTFSDVSQEAGINNHGFGLSVTTADYNNDGWTDIFVSNDWSMHDHLYINQKNGTFQDESKERFTKFSYSSMGSDASDFNNDGHLDLITVELDYADNLLHKAYIHNTPPLSRIREMQSSGYHTQYFRNALHLNNGDGTFVDIAYASNVGSTDWSWACFFADFDQDGWEDIFVTNGNYRQVNEDERPTIQMLKNALRRKDSVAYEKVLLQFDTVHSRSSNPFYKNNGDLTFQDMTQTWGSNHLGISHGAAYADFDNDGDLDVVVSNINESALVYKNNTNEAEDAPHYLLIKLKGEAPNTHGIGAKLMIDTKGERQYRRMLSSRGSQSSCERIIHFGLRDEEEVDMLVIEWADGRTQVLKGVETNQKITLDIQNAKNKKVDFFKNKKDHVPLFISQSEGEGLIYQHQENDFDDLYKQRLLPQSQSRGGPGIAVGDINGDGLEDYVVGASAQSPTQVFLQNQDARFMPQSSPNLEADAICENMGLLLVDVDNDGDKDLYIVSGGGEFPEGDERLQDRLYLNDGKGVFTKTSNWLPENLANGSCVAAADFDQDGRMDLFIGGAGKAGRYPEASESILLRNTGMKFENVTTDNAGGLTKVGMVRAAVWTDYDNDADPDLMVVGKWMAPQLFQNENGTLSPLQSPELEALGGWWNSIVPLDFDGDGDMDYALGNHGENTRFKPLPDAPLRIYHKDFDGNGSIDPIISYMQGGEQHPVAHLPDLAASVAFVAEEYRSYTEYGEATMKDLLMGRMTKAERLEAHTFASIILENQGGGKFQAHRLPQMAQVSPMFGMLAQDFDGDGYLDILAHGNFFEQNVQFERQDACTGLFLKGTGTPRFTAIPFRESGFFQNGEGRALAGILGADGQFHVLAGVNDNPLRHFKHQHGEARGIPIQEGMSAIVHHKDGRTTKYEFYPGAGYLSQQTGTILVNKDMITKIEGGQSGK